MHDRTRRDESKNLFISATKQNNSTLEYKSTKKIVCPCNKKTNESHIQNTRSNGLGY